MCVCVWVYYRKLPAVMGKIYIDEFIEKIVKNKMHQTMGFWNVNKYMLYVLCCFILCTMIAFFYINILEFLIMFAFCFCLIYVFVFHFNYVFMFFFFMFVVQFLKLFVRKSIELNEKIRLFFFLEEHNL